VLDGWGWLWLPTGIWVHNESPGAVGTESCRSLTFKESDTAQHHPTSAVSNSASSLIDTTPNMLCNFCSNFDFDQFYGYDYWRGSTYTHNANWTTLCDSADAGCDLCSLVRKFVVIDRRLQREPRITDRQLACAMFKNGLEWKEAGGFLESWLNVVTTESKIQATETQNKTAEHVARR
jgi:hypothetical protein